jgi:hypothetical protein
MVQEAPCRIVPYHRNLNLDLDGGHGAWSYTRSQNVHLKNLSFLAKSKIGFFACFFAQT